MCVIISYCTGQQPLAAYPDATSGGFSQHRPGAGYGSNPEHFNGGGVFHCLAPFLLHIHIHVLMLCRKFELILIKIGFFTNF